MVPPALPLTVAELRSADPFCWDLACFRGYHQAQSLLLEVAARLPFHVPQAGLLVLDWDARSGSDDRVRVQPRCDLHSRCWLEVPVAAVRPTGARVFLEDAAGESLYWLQMPARAGKAGARLPLATGLMRLSIQAHDEHQRFLPVVLRSDLAEDRYGRVSLHLHSLDLAALAARRPLPAELRRGLAAAIAGRALAMMSLPGAGLARETPMIVEDCSA